MSSRSYTQRRLHAQMGSGQQVCCPHPAPHSFRASWGPGGVLAFGSRSVRVAHLPQLDSVTAPSDEQLCAQRVASELLVFKATREAATRAEAQRQAEEAAKATDRGEEGKLVKTVGGGEGAEEGETWALAAEASLREHRQCAAAAAEAGSGREVEAQAALVDQHVWKAVAALFTPIASPSDHHPSFDGPRELAANLSSHLPSPPPLLYARRREAVLGWLRLALWDSALVRLEELAQREEVGGGGEVLTLLWALTSTLQQEAAVSAALEGDGRFAYMASLLAQPAECIREDVLAQIEADKRVGAGVGGLGGEDGEADFDGLSLFPQTWVQLMALLGGMPPEQGDVRHGIELPNPWGVGSEWMRGYALSLAFEPHGSAGPYLPCPTKFAPNFVPPCDPIFHLLLLYTGAQQPLAPLPPRVRELRSSAEKHWVRLADYSLSWQLMHTLCALLRLDPPACAPALTAGYMQQLELLGCWQELHYVNAVSAPTVGHLMCLFPPPDEPYGEMLDLLELEPADMVAPITCAAERLVVDFTDPSQRDEQLVQLFVTQATRARHQHRVVCELRQWLHALRIALVRLHGKRSLCAYLWDEAHTSLLRLLPAEVLCAGRGASQQTSRARGTLAALRLLHEAQMGVRGIGEQPGWAGGAKLYHDYLTTVDTWREFLELIACGEEESMDALTLSSDGIEKAAESLRMSIASRGNSLRRQMLEDERTIGHWTAQCASEVAALAEMARQVTVLPMLLRKHRELSGQDHSTPLSALPSLPDVLPQDTRLTLYRQLLDVAVA